MKRPQSRTTPRPKALSGLPSAPVQKQTQSQPKKPARPAAKPTKPARSIKPVKATKAAQATKLVKKRAHKNELRRLSAVRKSGSKAGLSSRLSAEARRFTAYSRRRRAISITVISAFSILLLVVLASAVTPIIAVEKITIAGADRVDKKAVQAALKGQIGTPLPAVSGTEIEGILAKFPLIESFSIIRLPPHALKIQITERQPIAIIKSGGASYLYDPAGVRVGKAGVKDKYPELTISGSPQNSENFKAAIDVLLALPASLLASVASIDAKSKDDVTMRLRGYSAQRIIWGDGSDSVLKSKVLAALIKNQKKGDYVTFDVSSPNAPTVRYGNF